MRSTSTSSNPGERGLFRLIVGAALALAGWRAFWKWALPARGPLTMVNTNAIMKDRYLKLLQEQLNNEMSGMLSVMRSDVNRQAFENAWGSDYVYVPPTTWEKRKSKFKRWLKGYKPVIMTTKKKEELEDYY